MSEPVISQAMEDYLKAIYKLREQNEQAAVSTSALSDYMKVAPASVTNMCKKLAELNLLTHEPYQGVKFTSAGEKLALEVVRHHRLIELYLAEALGVPWDQVHDEAEKLEHVISEDLEERMAAALGYPQFDPHGAPIPSRSGELVQPDSDWLINMDIGDRLVVVEVDDDDPALLRYLGEKGLYPGTEIHLTGRSRFEGPLKLEINGKPQDLSYQVAKTVLVAPQKQN